MSNSSAKELKAMATVMGQIAVFFNTLSKMCLENVNQQQVQNQSQKLDKNVNSQKKSNQEKNLVDSSSKNNSRQQQQSSKKLDYQPEIKGSDAFQLNPTSSVSPYMIFYEQQRDIIADKSRSKSELYMTISEKWMNLSINQKQKYKKKAQRKMEHHKAMEIYKYISSQERTRQKKQTKKHKKHHKKHNKKRKRKETSSSDSSSSQSPSKSSSQTGDKYNQPISIVDSGSNSETKG